MKFPGATTPLPPAGHRAFLAESMKTAVIIVADGARPDSLASAMDAGHLPALARLRSEGHYDTVSSVFPSVTGPAFTPLLMGRHPASVGLPALRWFDRSRSIGAWPHRTRSYVGSDMRHMDADLDPSAPTLFELAPPSLGALSVIKRGLEAHSVIGRGASFVLRTARIHFTGNVRGWLELDQEVAATTVARILSDSPRAAFVVLTGIDKTTHASWHGSEMALDAMRIVDACVAELRHGLEQRDRWASTRLWIVSDHGHSGVDNHEDLERLIRSFGCSVMAHPWVHRPARDVAVMVSGNAMAHLYLELDSRERRWWPALAERWEPLADFILGREATDLMLLPHNPNRCEVRARGRGSAFVLRESGGMSYRPVDGDPLGLGELEPLDDTEAHEACASSDYPDALMQLLRLTSSDRCGDIVLSAARNWDLRARYEPIPHLSAHGALHREHMLVPLLGNHPVSGRPRRTVDVFPSVLQHLGIEQPGGVEGTSFL